MKKISRIRPMQLVAAAPALVHWGLTFFTDTKIFEADPSVNMPDYVICKILSLAVLCFFYTGVFHVIFCKDKKSDRLCRILLRALPYMIVIIAVAAVKLPQGFLSNDETLIADSALHLEHDTWFSYLTVFYYIVSYMLIPVYTGPIFIKLVIELLVIGGLICRFEDVFGKPWWYFGYLLFLLYPVIAYTTSAHRLPVYFLLYLLLFTTLIFDGIEKKEPSVAKTAGLILLTAVLTQWRTEGIYLAILVPILMLFVYPSFRKPKKLSVLVLCSLLCQYLISVPQNGFLANEMGARADDRMKPFYAYTITNMFRNGLDTEKNAADLAIVDRYLALDKIAAINDYYGDINYEDVLILYQEGYAGVREEATITDYFDFANACKRIFRNNPGVFIKTRIGAFFYAAMPYRIEHGNGIRTLLVSSVKTVSYNLLFPVGFIFVLCLYALFRKRFFSFFVTGGILAHWFIVFILAPASYFKYYFPVYIMAFFYLLVLILAQVHRQKIRVLF